MLYELGKQEKQHFRKLSTGTKDWKISDQSMHVSTRNQWSSRIIRPVALYLTFLMPTQLVIRAIQKILH